MVFDNQVHCLASLIRSRFNKAMQETIYVGLDLGSSFCCQSVIDVDGSHRFSRLVPTSERHLRDAFRVSKARCGFIWRPESLPDGKRLSHPRLDNAGVGSLKDVSRKAFEAARRCKGDNSFKRVYKQSLENTKNAVHARLATQRKILATLRAMWIGNRPQ